jgi:shikimate kinase/3-dehydroquinate synthase
MDVVLVGLPGSGKSVVGRRLASRHGATFLDLDDSIERKTGRSIPEIFESEGEAAFRALERAAVADLGPADPSPALRRVISTGGGAVVDPRNRWALLRGRVPVWLDARPEVVAQRLRRSVRVRPMVAGRDPIGSVRELARARERFYAAAHHVNSVAEVASVVEAVDRLAGLGPAAGTILLRASTRIGDIVIGEGIASATVAATLRRIEARRAILVSEPGAWAAAGERLADDLHRDGWTIGTVLLPGGEEAKRLSVVEKAARELARMRVERGEPIVAIGGGALGDAAGFLAATYLRGIPWIGVPTTLVAQVDSGIGGKTAVDLPEGKNLVGAFHQPLAVVIDVGVLRSLPSRQLRAALGECVKMAALGDERLFALLESDGQAIARGDAPAWARGCAAEVVERAAWAKVETVLGDERETAGANGRIALNLGHTVGHALEAADGYATLLHGEAVAYGLRAAARIGVAAGWTPPERARRIEALLDRLELGVRRLPLGAEAVHAAMTADKKRASGRLRWVLPTADRYTVQDDIPVELVREVVDGLLTGSSVEAPA